MHWEVQITGDSSDIIMLAERFANSDPQIARREAEFVLLSSEFEALSSAGEVRERAKVLAVVLSGAARLALGSTDSLGVGAVYRVREDGKRDITVFPEPAVIRIRGMPVSVSVTNPDGEATVHRPADPLAAWLPLAHSDELVAKALRLRDQGSLEWVELYRIFEVIESDVGTTTMLECGWVTQSALTRFTRTANSVSAAGDAARHGRERTAPPPSPLPLSDARAMVDRILLGWLNRKAGVSS